MRELYFKSKHSRKSKAVFLDRDGTLNVDYGYVHCWGEWDWIERSYESIKRINELGLRVVIVTNQSGIARGYYGNGEVEVLHYKLESEIRSLGGEIDAILWCPHHEEITGPCNCRKPGDQMLRTAAQKLNISLKDSWMVGDKYSDIRAGLSAGTKAILLQGEDNERPIGSGDSACVKCEDLYTAVDRIEASLNG